MKKTFLLLAMLLSCALPAAAQFDLVTGQVLDPNGVPYSGATMRAQLVTTAGSPVTGTPTVTNASQAQCISAGLGNAPCQMPFPGTNSVTLDPAGNIPGGGLNLAHNPSVTPAGTQWLFSVTISPGIPPPAGTGPQSFSVAITINSNPQAIGATLSAAAPKLSNSSGGGGITPVSVLPGTCTPGTTPPVQLTVPPFSIYVCTATNVFTSTGGIPTAANFPSGMTFWYRFAIGDAFPLAPDYSGNNNTITGTVGSGFSAATDPPGGAVFTGAGGLKVPQTASTTTKTYVVLTSFQSAAQSSTFSSPIMGNGNGAPTNASGLLYCTQPSCGVNAFGEGTTTVNTYSPTTFNSGGIVSGNAGAVNGVHVVAMSMGAVDANYIDGIAGNTGGSSSAGLNLFPLQIGGAAAGSGAAVQTYFSGTILEAQGYSGALTQRQIQQAGNALIQDYILRGGSVVNGTTATTDTLVCNGDSQTGYNGVVGVVAPYCGSLVLSGSWTRINQGVTASTMVQAYQNTYAWNTTHFPYFGNAVGRKITVLWAGTNDFVLNATTAAVVWQNAVAFANIQRSALGVPSAKIIFVNTVSRNFTNFDANFKDAFNPIARQHWKEAFDGFVDLAAAPTVGADGASANTGNGGFIDAIHPTQSTIYNIEVPLIQREINGIYGNNDFSSANTYTTTTPAAVTITAASESTNTMTFTSASGAPPVSACAIVTGVTPAGYNTPANMCWTVLTSNGTTSWTAWNQTTGLGAGSVFGTFVYPQEVDADVYAILGGSAVTPNHVLQTCLGRTGHTIYREIVDTASNWTITDIFGATINGGASFTAPSAPSATNHPVVALKSILTSNTAGGCTWQASLQ